MRTLLDLASEKSVSSQSQKNIANLLEIDQKTARLEKIQALLVWDQEVNMPSEGVECRAEQMVLLEKLIHEEEVHPCVPEMLSSLGVSEELQTGDASFPPEIGMWLRAKYRQWKKSASLPPALAQEIVREKTKAHYIWVQARREKDFSIFADSLKRTIDLQREKADCLGYKSHRYDALVDEFEVGFTTEKLTTIFDKLLVGIIPLYKEVIEKQKGDTPLSIEVPIKEQKRFSKKLMDFVGFEKSFGRVDVSAHPFSTGIGRRDARITTSYHVDNPFSSILSVLHEMGHGFYDLGIDEIYKDTVCDDGASFGVHESQSRFLENIIGKSYEFWECLYPAVTETMGAFADVSLNQFMHELRRVHPNLIRIESDEIGYALHIALRFELERDLIAEKIGVNDLPELWNQKMKDYFGIVPSNDAEGVLQDVHWAIAYIGYFPSYELGNIFSVSLYNMLKKEIPDYCLEMSKGNYSIIREWLGKVIHQHGASKRPSELLPLNVDDTIVYLRERYLEEK